MTKVTIEKFTEPTALRQLVDRLGTHIAAGKEIGVSPSFISGVLSGSQKWRVTYELAARHALSKLDRNASAARFYFVRVPADKQEMFETIIKGLGLHFGKVETNG